MDSVWMPGKAKHDLAEALKLARALARGKTYERKPWVQCKCSAPHDGHCAKGTAPIVHMDREAYESAIVEIASCAWIAQWEPEWREKRSLIHTHQTMRKLEIEKARDMGHGLSTIRACSVCSQPGADIEQSIRLQARCDARAFRKTALEEHAPSCSYWAAWWKTPAGLEIKADARARDLGYKQRRAMLSPEEMAERIEAAHAAALAQDARKPVAPVFILQRDAGLYDFDDNEITRAA